MCAAVQMLYVTMQYSRQYVWNFTSRILFLQLNVKPLMNVCLNEQLCIKKAINVAFLICSRVTCHSFLKYYSTGFCLAAMEV